MGNHADGLAPGSQAFQSSNGDIKRVMIERAKTLIDEQRIDSDVPTGQI